MIVTHKVHMVERPLWLETQETKSTIRKSIVSKSRFTVDRYGDLTLVTFLDLTDENLLSVTCALMALIDCNWAILDNKHRLEKRDDH